MQLMHHHVSEEAVTFKRRNMTQLSDHYYIIGSIAKTVLTNEKTVCHTHRPR